MQLTKLCVSQPHHTLTVSLTLTPGPVLDCGSVLGLKSEDRVWGAQNPPGFSVSHQALYSRTGAQMKSHACVQPGTRCHKYELLPLPPPAWEALCEPESPGAQSFLGKPWSVSGETQLGVSL